MLDVAVLLAGCGLYDGSEAQETVLLLLALAQRGARTICVAPDAPQLHVVNHLDGNEATGSRQILEEAARLSRGRIVKLAEFEPEAADAVAIPGGYGVGKNLMSGFAIPGAIPPMIGWAAARGTLTAEAWALFGILFWWQLPHFFAIAWIWRADYERAGYPMLTVLDPSGRLVAREIIVTTLALIIASCAPFWLRMTGLPYLVGALVLGAVFLAFGATLARQKTDAAARRLFFASIVYLPLLLTLLLTTHAAK